MFVSKTNAIADPFLYRDNFVYLVERVNQAFLGMSAAAAFWFQFLYCLVLLLNKSTMCNISFLLFNHKAGAYANDLLCSTIQLQVVGLIGDCGSTNKQLFFI